MNESVHCQFSFMGSEFPAWLWPWCCLVLPAFFIGEYTLSCCCQFLAIGNTQLILRGCCFFFWSWNLHSPAHSIVYFNSAESAGSQRADDYPSWGDFSLGRAMSIPSCSDMLRASLWYDLNSHFLMYFTSLQYTSIEQWLRLRLLDLMEQLHLKIKWAIGST